MLSTVTVTENKDDMAGMSWVYSSGLRDPNMTVSERKLMGIICYLGLHVYKDMREDWVKMRLDRLRLLEAFTGDFADEELLIFSNRLAQINLLIESCEKVFSKLFDFLWSLAGNMESLELGSKFIGDLKKAGQDMGDVTWEIEPVATITMDVPL